MSALRRIGSQWDMLKVNAAAFYGALSDLRRMACMVEFGPPAGVVTPLSDKHREGIRRLGADLDAQLDALQTPMTKGWLRISLKALEKPGYSYARFQDEFGKLDTMLKDELSSVSVYSLESAEAALYEADAAPFGEKVEAAFPDAAWDLCEGGRCLATGCWTACIFHLMRGVEDALSVLATKLGATVVNSDGERLAWGIVLSNVKSRIDQMPKGSQRDEWYKVHSLFHALNRAFRTKSAHPGTKYGRDEATRAFQATKAFLEELAEHA
ncbi:MAG: hypothetical protein P4M09_10895 [Devosia sp.]|nr:hypothetical protein [Devosia sp.]